MNANIKNGKVIIGGELSEKQKKALSKMGMSSDEIFENMEKLNEELESENNEKKVSLKQKGKIINKKEQEMDLDKELEQLNQKLSAKKEKEEKAKQEVEEKVEAEEKEDGSIRNQILDLLKNAKEAPGERQIQIWKQQHGANGVYAIGMGEGDVYIFTHLKRGQWKKIQEIMAKMQQAGHENMDAEDEMKQKVVQHCVLWPKPLPIEFFYNSRAGVLDAIYQSILMNSYFLTPQQTMMLTTQL